MKSAQVPYPCEDDLAELINDQRVVTLLGKCAGGACAGL